MQMLGAGALALAVPQRTAEATSMPKPKIALQLYTVRKAIESDFEGTIRKVADVGFLGVETYTLPQHITLERAVLGLKDVGLKVMGMHTPLPVGENREVVLRLAEAYQCDRVIFPGGGEVEKYKTAAGIQEMVDLYNETGRSLEARGLHFGLHNHWMEFEKTGDYYPFYYLLEHLDKSIFFEIDTYWAKVAGMDPARIVRDFGARAPFLHIKDGPAIKGEPASKQLPAGKGAMDFPAIVKAGGRALQWMIVEFDDYEKDIFDGIQKSYSFLTRRKLAAGRI